VAMAWNKEHDARMMASLLNWRERPLIWAPYRDFANLWWARENYLLYRAKCLVEIDDWTDDFDTPDDYAEYCRRRAEAC